MTFLQKKHTFRFFRFVGSNLDLESHNGVFQIHHFPLSVVVI